ncbi:MAG: FHA domain-containing protein [Woeseiaceae bacterium]
MTEMDRQQQTQSVGVTPPKAGAALPFVTDGHRRALKELGGAFTDRRPLAILISDRKSVASTVMRDFYDGIERDVAIARVHAANSNAIAGMREITRAIGFDPKHMSVSEMENVLKMFLSYQKAHNRRTIICVEEAPDQGRWVLDRVQHLVELETEEKYGLMVILSGRPGLEESLGEHPLNELASDVAKRITTARPLADESQEAVRRPSAADNESNVNALSESRESTFLHRLRRRVPDAAKKIYVKYFDLHESEKENSGASNAHVVEESETQIVQKDADDHSVEKENLDAVTADASMNAETQILEKPATQLSAVATRKTKGNDANPVVGRLIVHVDDEIIQTEVLKRDNILIGRSKMCDLRLLSEKVSRHHAMVVNSANGTEIVDLRSMNGTLVDGSPVQRQPLQDSDAISISGYLIRYIAND